MSCAARLQAVLNVAVPVADILAGRVADASVPGWCERRGWADFLLGLSEAQLRRAEAQGLAAALPTWSGAPPELRELAGAVESAVQLPMLAHVTPLASEALRSVKLRKRAQLSGLLGAVAGMAEHAERIVDVGAGSGHFTRLSAELFQRQALGLERNAERVAAAERRSNARGEAAARSDVRFEAVDARDGLAFTERDLAIGLHACGELGDRLIEAAARSHCDVALVSCCLQKITPERRAALASTTAALELRKEHLGLSNLTPQPQGVEESIDVTIAARQTRHALAGLLRARGIELEPGAEMSGINRRRANAGLAEVAALALALRNLPPATSSELAHHEALGAAEYARIRRLALPRSMLARLVEVLVSLDRATHLEERGQRVLVATLFERAVSPRNIGIFASRSLSRLPAA